MKDGCPAQPQRRHVGRQHVVSGRLDAAFDPGDEVVERPLAHLTVAGAVTAPAHGTLHEQVCRTDGERAAPVGLLQLNGRASPVSWIARTGTVMRPVSSAKTGSVARERARRGREASDVSVQLVFVHAQAGIDVIADAERAGGAPDRPAHVGPDEHVRDVALAETLKTGGRSPPKGT